ncbi:hypothetical protein M413DRAFT_32763 [Hebeloma cylindrosporum]|uniref:CxC2-like cysteine cluster KDZ transposase-associated domain-containing protein n=1 Tax=Hebeloma cylindrosporum TaxID=76867 RepID=A0A0C3BUT0_HEBCY|nr:hypothetical protein M413DRAFT_32763 [Hebeloma cylindrosporum h7]
MSFPTVDQLRFTIDNAEYLITEAVETTDLINVMASMHDDIGKPICDTLSLQVEHLEHFEQQKDIHEQERLCRAAPDLPTPKARQPDEHAMDCDTEGIDPEQERLDDDRFESYLERLYRREQNSDLDEDEDEDKDKDKDEGAEVLNDPDIGMEADDNTVVADEDAEIVFPQYLPDPSSEDAPQMPTRDVFQNSYVRIVHTNGLHHLAMVSCHCRGTDLLPQDLIASRLVPASFKNIRTLFSAQALDFFRLCNLEMKASAYQFYHLLRRLTMPMAPAEVVDLYNEFRRMTRLWRWMKKLKWAGLRLSTSPGLRSGAPAETDH